MSPSVKFSVDDIPQGFPPLPEDQVFTLEIQGAEVKRSKASGAPYANLKLVVCDHPELTGRIVFEMLPLPDETIYEAMTTHPIESERKKLKDAIGTRCFRLRQALLALGPAFEIEFEEGTDGQKAWNVSKLIGGRFEGKMKTEEYQGEHKSRIDVYLPRVS